MLIMPDPKTNSGFKNLASFHCSCSRWYLTPFIKVWGGADDFPYAKVREVVMDDIGQVFCNSLEMIASPK